MGGVGETALSGKRGNRGVALGTKQLAELPDPKVSDAPLEGRIAIGKDAVKGPLRDADSSAMAAAGRIAAMLLFR